MLSACRRCMKTKLDKGFICKTHFSEVVHASLARKAHLSCWESIRSRMSMWENVNPMCRATLAWPIHHKTVSVCLSVASPCMSPLRYRTQQAAFPVLHSKLSLTPPPAYFPSDKAHWYWWILLSGIHPTEGVFTPGDQINDPSLVVSRVESRKNLD